jgi:hypothetical protein
MGPIAFLEGAISSRNHVCSFPRRRRTRFRDFNEKIRNIVSVQPSYQENG